MRLQARSRKRVSSPRLRPRVTSRSPLPPAQSPGRRQRRGHKPGTTITFPAWVSAQGDAAASQRLSVQATDAGGPSNLTYTWTVTAAPAGAGCSVHHELHGQSATTVSVAFHQAGRYTFMATVANRAVATVSRDSADVTVGQVLGPCAVSPGMATVNAGQSLSFTRPPGIRSVRSGPRHSADVLLDGDRGREPGGRPVHRTFNGRQHPSQQRTRGTSRVRPVCAVSLPSPTLVTPASASPAVVTGVSGHATRSSAPTRGRGVPDLHWAVTAAPAGVPIPAFSVAGHSNAAKTTTASFADTGSYGCASVTISDPSGLAASSVVSVGVNVTTTITVTPGLTALFEGRSSFAAAAQTSSALPAGPASRPRAGPRRMTPTASSRPRSRTWPSRSARLRPGHRRGHRHRALRAAAQARSAP